MFGDAASVYLALQNPVFTSLGDEPSIYLAWYRATLFEAAIKKPLHERQGLGIGTGYWRLAPNVPVTKLLSEAESIYSPVSSSPFAPAKLPLMLV